MFARWCVFGQDPHDGTYHVSDGRQDVVIGLTEATAIALVTYRNLFVDTMLGLINTP
jgi:hypothetical protein